jgi:hypothetical protein
MTSHLGFGAEIKTLETAIAGRPGSPLRDSEKTDPPMADFYAALHRQNEAAPLADFATALNSGASVRVVRAHIAATLIRERLRLGDLRHFQGRREPF